MIPSDEPTEEEEVEQKVDITPENFQFNHHELKSIESHFNELLTNRPYWMRSKSDLDKGTFVKDLQSSMFDDFVSKLFVAFVDHSSANMRLNQYIQCLDTITYGDIYKLIIKMYDMDRDNKLTRPEFNILFKTLKRIDQWYSKSVFNNEEDNSKKEKKEKNKDNDDKNESDDANDSEENEKKS